MALTNTNVDDYSLKLENKLSPSLCRVCMAHNTKMKCVFSYKSSLIIEQFEFCTGILITKEDGLPTMLCELCSTTMTIAHKFKTSCLRSDEILRTVIKKQKDVKIEIDEVLNMGNQDWNAKQEVDSGDDRDTDDDFLCNITTSPKPTTRTRLKVKSKNKINKNTIASVKKKISGKRRLNTKESRKGTEETDERFKELTCLWCNIKFNSTEEQIQHRKDKHGDCEWICEICGKMFKYRSSHHSHVRSHLPPTFNCQLCDYRAHQRADMNKHLKMHKGIKDYVCEYCTRRFGTTSNLREHIRRHHGGGAQRRHACARCGRAFHAADKLRRHLDTHDNIKRFECEVCQDRFSRRCQWKAHLIKIHNIIIPRAKAGRRKSNVLVAVKHPIDSVNMGEQYCEVNKEK